MIQQPVLVAHRELIRQKITILALMELAFTRKYKSYPATLAQELRAPAYRIRKKNVLGTAGRTITFAEISETCRLPESEVRFLRVPKAGINFCSSAQLT
mmetsp:Transcript_1971/g.7782  ORF Transcript_1971/g.7782 Transcript_1971/m.7782 type:complete len:99 (+) Transcript_1971:1079-1375(+)